MADFRLTMMDQCGRCHEEESETFFDTFHGKVSRLGDAAAAKCYDCHGTHGIQPTTRSPLDAQPTQHRRDLRPATPAPTEVHRLPHPRHPPRPRAYPFLFWAFWGMTTLLIGTLTFASLHTGAWLWRLARSPELRVAHVAKEGSPEKLFRRFTSFQRSCTSP